MNLQLIRDAGWQFVITLWHVFPWLAGMGLVFSLLSFLAPCNAGRPWWRKSGLVTDLAYWVFVPVFSRYLRIWLTVVGTILIFHVSDGQAIADFYRHGHGAIGTLPLWLQGAIYLVVTDFVLYWSHRLFHSGVFWKYHAVHHAPEQVEWLSAARFHPVNLLFGAIAMDVVMLLAGVSPEVFIVLGPFNTMVSTYAHANMNWTGGPLRYVFVSPVFHRWHHVVEPRDRNFAGVFPVWDVLFGTFYMPQGVLPQNYGIADMAPMPEGLGAQLLYPLKV
ncbi:MAG: sterol desaturase family protein [Alphaproteobacteria bacterium]|nr:sterol desaturase family protein [Alphaproteobacteria bacterium]